MFQDDTGRDAVKTNKKDAIHQDKREHPWAAFDGQSFESPWGELQIAYFNSYALWTYLTIPFLYADPAFVTEELSPWLEDGEEWRRLKALSHQQSPVTVRNKSRASAQTDCCEGTRYIKGSYGVGTGTRPARGCRSGSDNYVVCIRSGLAGSNDNDDAPGSRIGAAW